MNAFAVDLVKGDWTMKPSGIGGQAVMEGVMMKNGDEYAVAVRLPNGEITVKREEYKGIVKGKKFLTLPPVVRT